MNVSSLTPSPGATRSSFGRLKKLGLSLLLLGGVTAAGYSVWFYRQWSRPGNQHYQAGLDDMAAQRPMEAEQEWLLGVREDPDSPVCYEELAKLYATTARFREAAGMYAAACRLLPEEGSLFLQRAKVEHHLGQTKEELEAAKRAAELLPDDPEAIENYGVLQETQGDRTAALQALHRAHQLRPDDSGYLVELVNTEMDALDFRGAEADLAPYLQAHPDDAQACYLMAAVYDFKPRTPENLQKAIGLAQHAIDEGLRDAHVYMLLGRYTLDSGRPVAAVRDYEEAERLFPEAEAILQGLVRCYSRLGNKQGLARASAKLQQVIVRHDRISRLKLVLGYRPDDTATALELARLEEQDGDYSLARRYYEESAQKAPRDAHVQNALAAFRERMRRMGDPQGQTDTVAGAAH